MALSRSRLAVFLSASFVFGHLADGASVGEMSEAALRAAIATSSSITFSTSGVITLSAPLTTTGVLTIDGSGQSITLSGENSNRIFEVGGGRLILKRLTLTRGSSPSGGAIYNDGGLVEIIDCSLVSNRANGVGGPLGNYFKGYGGAFYNGSAGRIKATGSLFLANLATYTAPPDIFGAAGYGGVGYGASTNGVMDFVNCTFSQNSAVTAGAGIIGSGQLTITSCTFFANQGAVGGSQTFLKNSLFVQSPCYARGFNDLGNNISSDFSYPGAGVYLNPGLRALADNGGPTLTHALQLNSPAVNYFDRDQAPPTDQRAAFRVFGRADVGAFEVTTLRDKDFEFSATNVQAIVQDRTVSIVMSRRSKALNSPILMLRPAASESNLPSTNIVVDFANDQITRAVTLEVSAKPIAGTNRVLVAQLRRSVDSADVIDEALVELLENDGVIGAMDEVTLRNAIENGGTHRFIMNGTINISKAFEVVKDTALDAGTNEVILAGMRRSRFFNIHPGARLTLSNIKMFGGFAAAPIGQPGFGGAILNDGGAFFANKCQFLTNYAVGGNGVANPFSLAPGFPSKGGAVFSRNGSIELVDCTFTGNQPWGGSASMYGPGGDAFGAAIAAESGTLVADRCRFISNGCVPGGNTIAMFDSSGNAGGGALAMWDVQASFADCAFEGNGAGGGFQVARTGSLGGAAFGGGIYLEGGTLVLDHCTFRGNFADGGVGFPIGAWGSGGAIYIKTGAANITNSVFAANRALGGYGSNNGSAGTGLGGAICNEGTLVAENCSFATNSAIGGSLAAWVGIPGDALGGTIYNSGGTATLRHTTTIRSVAQPGRNTGADGYIWPDKGLTSGSSICSTNGSVQLTHSIVAHGVGASNCFGPVIDGGGNVSSDGTPPFIISNSLNNTDPQVGSFGKFPGATETFTLRENSPARDRAPVEACSNIDQRGRQRPHGLCDAGAFEFQPPFVLAGTLRSSTPLIGATVSLGSSSVAGDSTGKFLFENAVAGSYILGAAASERICVPLPKAFEVEEDVLDLEFRTYPTGALYFDRDPEKGLALVYGGNPNQSVEIQTAGPSMDWQSLGQAILSSTGGLHAEISTNEPAQFFRLKLNP